MKNLFLFTTLIFSCISLMVGCSNSGRVSPEEKADTKSENKKQEQTPQIVSVEIPERIQKIMPADAEAAAYIDLDLLAENSALIKYFDEIFGLKIDKSDCKDCRVFIFGSIINKYYGLYIQSKNGEAEILLNSLLNTEFMRNIDKQITEKDEIRSTIFPGGFVTVYNKNEGLLLLSNKELKENTAKNSSKLLNGLENKMVSITLDVTKLKHIPFKNKKINRLKKILTQVNLTINSADGKVLINGYFKNPLSAALFVMVLKKYIKKKSSDKDYDYLKDVKITVKGSQVILSMDDMTKPVDKMIQKIKLRVHNLISASKLKIIGKRIATYGNQSKNAPESLSQIIMDGKPMNPEIFIAPFDEHSVPFTQGSLCKSENSTYAYLGKGLASSAKGCPVMIEKPWLLPKDSKEINVLFMNGTVRPVKGIKDLEKKTCCQAVEIICKKYSIPKDQKMILLKNAELVDKQRKETKKKP